MATIVPFIPYRYNLEIIADAGAVIAPPYDVISDSKHAALLQRNPHNIIRLILPEGNGNSRYSNAGLLFREWIDTRVFIQDSLPAFFAYSQVFAHPATGDLVQRLGFMARVALSPFSDGEILPHERTLKGPKEDRMKLMQATDANLEPIFGVYHDSEGDSARRLARVIRDEAPLITATDIDGITHKLWGITDPATIEHFTADVRDTAIYIVDGHHRYETALAYRNRQRAEQGTEHSLPADYIMMYLAPTSDPGLIILPTHRVIHSLQAFSIATLLEQLRISFSVQEISLPEEGLALLRQQQATAYLLLADNRAILITLREEVHPDDILDAALPDPLKQLDVTILHDFILEHHLGITKEAQEQQRNIRYIKSDEEALGEAGNADAQLVIMMNATRLEQVEAVAESGGVMPQKSTYFYPKLASGLLVNPLW